MTSWLPTCVCSDCGDQTPEAEVAQVYMGVDGTGYAVAQEDEPRAAAVECVKVKELNLREHSPPPMPRQSGSTTSKSAALEFDAQVMKGSGKIGVDIVVAKDSKAVIVSKVKAGAIQDFNSSMEAAGKKDSVIKRGDRVVEVDGRGRGDAGEISTALKNSSAIMDLKLVRLLEFKVANQSREACGFTFAEGPDGELLLNGLEPAANKSLQPDVELRVGDCIVKVNGKSGTYAQLLSEIGASDVLSLQLRRARETK